MKIKMPVDVRMIIDRIEKNGFSAYAVGGCVRDSLLQKEPNDWDICTNALPTDILRIFQGFHTFDAGIKHGTVSVVVNSVVYEITTFRIDGEYFDNRHPENVEFTDDLITDLSRRDFTVNAMAYSERTGLVDPFDGAYDLELMAVRCVGNPVLRFNEDALRIMRALRFASCYNMAIEKHTAQATFECKNLLKNIAAERIVSEFNKLVCGESCEYILRRFKTVFAEFLPEITIMFGYEQHTPHHNKTLWRHTTCAMTNIDPEPLLRITMLLHDLGKPMACKKDPDGTAHFKGHPKFSAVMARQILERLKYSREFIDDCVTLIAYHDVRLTGSKPQIRRVMNKIGETNMRRLLKVQYADLMAQSMYKRDEKLEKFNLACKSFDEIVKEKDCFTLKQLDINGHDLIKMGITDGKQIGETLNKLLGMVMDETLENKNSILIQKAKEINSL